MRSLFWRLFLWFWLVTAVIIAAQIVLSPYWTRSTPELQEWEASALERLERHLDGVAARVAAGGAPQPAEPRGPGRGRRRPSVFVVGVDGRTPEGVEPPREVRQAARDALEVGETVTRRRGLHFVVARPAVTENGTSVVVVAAGPSIHPPPPAARVLTAPDLAPRLAIVVLVVGALSWWLARWLTGPIRSLRTAVADLGRGDLGARVDPNVAKRRDETGELAREFDAMAERIQRLVVSHRQLLQDVSHELRSPLARLGVALELARQRAGGAAEEPLDRVQLEAERLDQLIEQLLVLARLERGDDSEPVAPVDLGEVLREVADDAAFEARGRDVDVESLVAASCCAPPSTTSCATPCGTRVRPPRWRSSLRCTATERGSRSAIGGPVCGTRHSNGSSSRSSGWSRPASGIPVAPVSGSPSRRGPSSSTAAPSPRPTAMVAA